MRAVTAFVSGLVFGLGLLVSQMVDPAKVQAFLDVAGAFDPSLAFVLLGAASVGAVAFALAKGRARSLLGAPMQIPDRRDIDARLLLGSLAFGVGWGMAGICPGPAVVALGAGQGKAAIFVAAMLVGMAIFEGYERRAAAAAGALTR